MTRRVAGASVVALAFVSLMVAKPRLAANDIVILFHGYIGGHGTSATATITDDGATNIKELPLPNGGDLSPSANRVAFDTCERGHRAVAIAALDGSGRRTITPVSGESCVTVRWSRDGTRISYAGAYDDVVHIVDLTTSIDTPLPNTFLTPGWHTWSARDDAIAYEIGRGCSRRIDIIDLGTWRTRTLVGPHEFGSCEVWAPDWSPSADRIAFTTCDHRLFVINTDGTELRSLAANAYAPRWAPDGTSVLFLTGTTLRRISPDGSRDAQSIGRLPFGGGPFSLAAR